MVFLIMAKKRFKSTVERARIIRAIVEEHYEEGRQDRCKLWVYRNVIRKQYPMSERTFFRLLSLANEPQEPGKKGRISA